MADLPDAEAVAREIVRVTKVGPTRLSGEDRIEILDGSELERAIAFALRREREAAIAETVRSAAAINDALSATAERLGWTSARILLEEAADAIRALLPRPQKDKDA